MADPYRVTDDWQEGYEAGYESGYEAGLRRRPTASPIFDRAHSRPVQKPKRKQSGKQMILTQMAKKAWDKYKKGNGKKSYIDIRAQVSRSQAYKKKTKGM